MEAECRESGVLSEEGDAKSGASSRLPQEILSKRKGPLQEIEEDGSCSSGTDGSMMAQHEDQERGDERLAAVLQLQLVQQKQEMMAIEEAHAVTKADALFRTGLEQLIGEHLKTCMADAFVSGGGDSPCLEGFVCTEDGGIVGVHGSPEVAAHVGEGSGRSGQEASESGALMQGEVGELDEEEGLLTRRRSSQAPGIDTLSRDAELVALARMQAVSTMLGASFLQDEPAASSSRHLEFEPYMQRAHLEALERWRNLEIQRHIEMEELQSRQGPRGVIRRRPDSGLASTLRADSQQDAESNSELTADSNSELRTGSQSAEDQQEEGVLQDRAGADSGEESTTTSNSSECGRPTRQEQETSQPLEAQALDASPTDPCQQGPANEASPLSVSEMVRQRESARARAEEGAQREQQMLRRRAQQRDRFLELEAAWERERERELAGLGQQRAVSDFAHRTRLQSLFRGHFLRQNPGEASSAAPSPTPPARAEDMNFLRERRPVSGIRELFRHNLENIVRRQASGEAQTRTPPVTAGSASNQGLVNNQGSDNLPQARVNGEGSTSQQSGAQTQQAPQGRWVDEASVYNMELQELLARRSVSTTLTSTFRNRLEALIESFVLSRVGNHAPPPPIAAPQAQPAIRPPVPPPMPQAPLWQPAQIAAAAPPARWNSAGSNVHDLREGMRLLQQEMEQMRGLMQNCFEMQLELQRSIRQEVAGALQRGAAGNCHVADMHMDGAKWAAIKRGVCCVCCESPIDTLMYRCGHMCACHRCARQLQQTTETCPMCRAPIIEVVRAFTTA